MMKILLKTLFFYILLMCGVSCVNHTSKKVEEDEMLSSQNDDKISQNETFNIEDLKLNEEAKHLFRCREKWEYIKLENELEVSVLYFTERSFYSIMEYSNFIIGRTSEGDTIGLSDLEYDSIVNIGDTVKFGYSEVWEDESKMRYIKPVFTVFKDTDITHLYCTVRKVYNGKIISVR